MGLDNCSEVELLTLLDAPLGTHTSSLELLTYNPTNLKRVSITNSYKITDSTPKEAFAYAVTKAMQQEPNAPLLAYRLPLLTGTQSVRALVHGTPTDLTVHNTNNTITKLHLAALKEAFKDEWVKHVRKVLVRRDVTVLDVFDSKGVYLGGIILSKWAAWEYGELVPCLSIECIVSAKNGGGGGNAMFGLAKTLLFTDDHSLTHGYLFGQCLEAQGWWDAKLNVSATATCLVAQMVLLEKAYDHEECCLLRSKRVDVRDMHMPCKAACTATPGRKRTAKAAGVSPDAPTSGKMSARERFGPCVYHEQEGE